MIAQFAGQDQRNWDEKWPEIMLAVNTSTSESTGHRPAFLTQGREPRLPSSLYDKETLGTGRATETPEEYSNKLREVFKIVWQNIKKASQDQARHYNLRRRQWSPAVGDIVWATEHQLSKAAEGFTAKLVPRYDGSYQVLDIVSPARQQVSASGASQNQPITQKGVCVKGDKKHKSRSPDTYRSILRFYTECAGRACLVVTRGKGEDGEESDLHRSQLVTKDRNTHRTNG